MEMETEAETEADKATFSSQLAAEEERLIVKDIAMAAEALTKEGDLFFLLSLRWWQNWLEYVNQDMVTTTNDGPLYGSDYYETANSITPKRPSHIDNSDLIYDTTMEDSNIDLHDALIEGRDYILLPEEVWKQLHAWYGGGPTLTRKVINSGLSEAELTVEVYPLRLQLLLMPKGEHAVVRISKKETVGELHRRACNSFDLVMEHVHIWDFYGHQKYALMSDMSKTLEEADIQMDQDILVEALSDGNGTFGGCASSVQDNGSIEKESTSVMVEPCRSSVSIAGGLSTNKSVTRSCSSELSQSQHLASPVRELDTSYGTNSMVTRGATGGLTGLLNLGNTCFMNSAIQCLVHTPEFARYFREDYHQEINWQNPLGMVGELALAFGELLRKLWTPSRTPIAPRPFKAKLARFAPQFSGYNQHDSQELLAFLLDGLHEDLNRVKDKPYVKSKDADGRPDEEVADEYWANHIARNDSIIVDVCQGQYKSTLVCPVCGNVSITFDPFMYLSLPLQSATTRPMTVTVFNSDGSGLPTAYTVNVLKQGRCKDLVQALSSACFLKPGEKLLLAEIRGHMIHRFLEDPLTSLSTIKDDDHLAAYRFPKFMKNSIFLQLIHRREEMESSNSHSQLVYKSYGTPLVAPILRDEVITRGDIQLMVYSMLSPMLRAESPLPSDTRKTASAVSDPSSQNARLTSARIDSATSIDMDQNGSLTGMASKLLLQLVDENNACIDLTTGEEKTIRLPSSSTSIKVFLVWSKKIIEKYDPKSIENLPEVHKYGHATKKARMEPLSLYTCLEAFLREEPLVPEDMWYCPKCKEQRQASKKLDLWRLPEVLVIHLKRFSYIRSMKHKLETFVNFPIHDLDLTKYVAHKNSSRRQLYELYALSNHYGGMGSGHYTAHIKLLDENRWYNFDDSHISPINEEDVKSSAAYVLFYRRVKGDDSSATNGVPPSADHANVSRRK